MSTKVHRINAPYVSQLQPRSFLSGYSRRLVGRLHFVPSLSTVLKTLVTAANDQNSAILLTQAFNRILFYFCNRRHFGVCRAKAGIGEKPCVAQP